MNQEMRRNCPLCGSSESKLLVLRAGDTKAYSVSECKFCGFGRTVANPENELPKSPDFGVYYGKRPNKFVPVLQMMRNSTMRVRAQKYLALVPATMKKLKILDVGCAEGRLLRAFYEKGCECWGVEHPAYPEERFLFADRITYLKGDLGELDLPEEGFDLIFLWHVLEHLDDPDRTVRRLHEILRPEGLIVLAVPNFASLESRCFRKDWFHLDLPWHRCHFTIKTLRYLIGKNQLEISNMNSLCLEQGPYGFIQSLLNAMGWPKNELYEALKGNWTAKRTIPLMAQFGLLGFLAIPSVLVSVLAALEQKGSVLNVVLKKAGEFNDSGNFQDRSTE